jgi:hypothetical protein
MLPSPPLTASSFYKYFYFFIPTNIINAAATNGNCKRQALHITQSRFASPSASSAHDFIPLPPFYFHYAQSANSHHCLGTITMHLTQAAPTTSSHSQCTCTAQPAFTMHMHCTISTHNAYAPHNQHSQCTCTAQSASHNARALHRKNHYAASFARHHHSSHRSLHFTARTTSTSAPHSYKL